MHSIGKGAETNRSAKRGGRNPVPATKQKGRIALWGRFSFSLPVDRGHGPLLQVAKPQSADSIGERNT
jgi:hypothetical protein